MAAAVENLAQSLCIIVSLAQSQYTTMADSPSFTDFLRKVTKQDRPERFPRCSRRKNYRLTSKISRDSLPKCQPRTMVGLSPSAAPRPLSVANRVP